MIPELPDFMAYGPGNRAVDVVKRIHEGKTPNVLSLKALVSLGVPEGNAPRIDRALRFLGLVNPERELSENAVRLRKATSDEYQSVLAEIVHGAYKPIFESYDPATATDVDLNNAFKPYDPAGQRGQMIALFMALCREAGLAPESSEVRRRGRPTTVTVQRFRDIGKTPSRKTPSNEKSASGNSVEALTAHNEKSTANNGQFSGILFHPAIDAYLAAARRIIESDGWTQEARDRVVQGFETQLDLFLPVKK